MQAGQLRQIVAIQQPTEADDAAEAVMGETRAYGT